jgi:hypothetical protein
MDLTGKLNTVHASYTVPTLLIGLSGALFLVLLVVSIVKGAGPKIGSSIVIVTFGSVVTSIVAVIALSTADGGASAATTKQNAATIHQAAKDDGLFISKRDAGRIAERRTASTARQADDGDRPIVVLATKDGVAAPLLVSWSTQTKITVAPVTAETASALVAGTND